MEYKYPSCGMTKLPVTMNYQENNATTTVESKQLTYLIYKNSLLTETCCVSLLDVKRRKLQTFTSRTPLPLPCLDTTDDVILFQ